MSFPIPESVLKNARVLATDVDDTLTIGHRIPGENLTLISKLREAGLKVLLVTGRTAGHGLSMSTWVELDGAIAENGGIICQGENARTVDSFSAETFARIKTAYAEIGAEFPEATPTGDNFMRLTDQTFSIEPFSPERIERATEIASKHGLGIIYSSVHLHVCDPGINKGKTLTEFLASQGITDLERVITIGDSPNDEAMLNPDNFPNSCGVKNVENYRERLQKMPKYVLPVYEGHGFAMLAKALLDAKR
jgi:HAD superfamily hydrolase (TIGR01484 family)